MNFIVKNEGYTMTKKFNTRKLSVLMVALLFAASTVIPAAATTITGVTGNNGVYNIDPTKSIGSTGFRSYRDFNLDSGDVANLNYANISRFVNMVDNKININGVVNTLRNGKFFNGDAVFMSPNGMVVGANGVLNVGSLTVNTPTRAGMEMLRRGVEAGNLTTTYDGKEVNLLEAMGWHGNAPVTINGKVYSHGDVNMVANTFTLGNTGYIGAGITDETVLSSSTADISLFDALVNTGRNSGAQNGVNNTTASRSSNISIRSYDRSAGNLNDPVGAVIINGKIENLGKGDTVITNRGTQGLTVGSTGEIYNSNGNLHLVNGKGEMNIKGLVQGDGDSVHLTNVVNAGKMIVGGTVVGNAGTRIYNRSKDGVTLDGQIINSGKGLAITNEKGMLNMNGRIENGTAMNVSNKGEGIVVNGEIQSRGKMQMSNSGANGITINGDISNSAGTAITNVKGDFIVTEGAKVATSAGKLNLTNKGNALKVNGNVTGSGEEVLVQNVGAGGFDMNGVVNNKGRLFLQNTKGEMNINGDVIGSGANANGKDYIYIGNSGSGLKISNDANVIGNGTVQIVNSGQKGMTVDGVVNNYHSSNSAKGTSLMNTAGDLKINGSVVNTKGNLNVTNKGNKLAIGENGNVGTGDGELTLQNTGAGGMDIDGKVMSKGTAYVYNKAGDMNVNGLLLEEGQLYVTNAGKALNVAKEGTVKASGIGAKINMLNKGTNGMNINGLVTDTGKTLITNQKGDLNINGNVSNKSGMLQITNTGNALNIAEDASVTNDTNRTYITNQGAGGMDIDGTVTTKGHVVVTNRAGGMNIDGKVTSTKANAVLTNTGDEDTVIDGTVRANRVKVYAKDNDIVLGNKDTKQFAINGLKKVTVVNDNGSIKNAGVDTHIIKSGGNLYMAATNGSIGEDVNTDGIAAENRDLTKSVNVWVNGRVKAFTTDKNKNSAINIATKGKDLRVDRIKADGKAIITTDKDSQGNTGSILNDATELDKYANVKGTSVHMISSGSIGTKAKPIHFRQTDATKDSNVLAVKDVYLHARGEAEGEDVKVGTIKSKEGLIEADLIKNAYIENAVAPGAITITSRKEGAKLEIKNKTHDANVIKDYFD